VDSKTAPTSVLLTQLWDENNFDNSSAAVYVKTLRCARR